MRSAHPEMPMLRDLSLAYKTPLRISVLVIITAFLVTAALVARERDELRRDLIGHSENVARVLTKTLIEPIVHDDAWRAFEIINTPFQSAPGGRVDAVAGDRAGARRPAPRLRVDAPARVPDAERPGAHRPRVRDDPAGRGRPAHRRAHGHDGAEVEQALHGGAHRLRRRAAGHAGDGLPELDLRAALRGPDPACRPGHRARARGAAAGGLVLRAAHRAAAGGPGRRHGQGRAATCPRTSTTRPPTRAATRSAGSASSSSACSANCATRRRWRSR